MLRDAFDTPFYEEDTVAVSTTRGIRVGRVERINISEGDVNTTYTVTILRLTAPGRSAYPTRRQTLPYSKENYYKVC